MRKLTIVEKDHKAMIEDGVFTFCPYCAYPLKKPKRHVNFEYEQGKSDKEAYAKQKQIEVLEKVIKKCELWGQFYLDDFEDWLEEELKRLSK